MKKKHASIASKIVLPKSGGGRSRFFFREAFDKDANDGQQLALIVDDDKSVRKAIKYVLERRLKLKVYVASNGAEGIRQVRDHHFDLIISDVCMPIMDGIMFYDWLDKNRHEDLSRFMFITGGNNAETDIHSFRGGRVKVLDKPFALTAFIQDCNFLLTS